MTHVPYRGGGPLLQDPQQAGTGQLVPLAVTSAARQAAFPKVPTIAETIAPGFEQATWMGFFSPKGVPAEIRQRLHQAITAALAAAGVPGRLADLGFAPVGGDGGAFARLFDETVKTFADIASDRQIVAGD